MVRLSIQHLKLARYDIQEVNLSLYYSLRIIPSGVFRPLSSLEMLVLDNNFLSTLSLSGVDGLGNLQVPQVFVACTYQILIENQYFMFCALLFGRNWNHFNVR